MFLTFSSPSHAKGRRRVRQACENCRLFRVRCNGQQPCARCQTSPRRCVYASSKPASKPAAPSSVSHQASDASSATPPTQPRDDTPVPPPSPQSTPPAAASPEFASRINDYFTSISELVLHSPPPQYSALSQPSRVDDHSDPTFTHSQRAALLRLFARRLYPLVPIFDLAALTTAHDAHPDQPLPPLACAAIALAIQYACCSSLSDRMLGLGLPAPSAGADASLAGYHLVTRCRTLLATSSLELDPSLADVQCHVLMSLFLINAGHLKPAYSLLGSAVRMAYSLHLHRPVSGDNADLCSRTWWTLVQLDYRCSSLLRRPVAFHWSEISCPLPREDPAWSYHTYAVRLTAAILSGTHGSGRKQAPGPEGALALVEAQAKMLAETLGPVRDWERSLQESEPFSTLNLDPDIAIAQSGHTDGVSTISDSGTVQALQMTLLKVHYHNSLMTIYRAYIRFPFRSLTPLRSPRVDVNATMAVKHAIALTATIFDSFHVDDLLYGICEVYHAQWNAVLTMAGFILSYPLCRYSRLARQHFPKAIAVFDTVAGRIATVGRLAVVGRDLCDRVDRLVRLAEESQKAKEISEAGPRAPHPVEGAAAYSGGDAPGMASSVTLNAIGSPFVTPDARGDLTNHPSLPLLEEQNQHIAIQDSMTGPNVALPAVEQDLWSWMDIVGLPSWPDYQHGIDELFTDITDLDVLMDGSFEGFDA